MKKSYRVMYVLLFVLGFSVLSCRNDDTDNRNPYNPNDASVPKVSFVTSLPLNDYVSVTLTIKDYVEVDFGDGKKVKYTKDPKYDDLTIDGRTKGKEIKIYAPNPNSITELYLSDNKMTSLDIRNSIEVTKINLWGNELTNLDISKNTKLISLDYSHNIIKQKAANEILNALPPRIASDKAVVFVSDNYYNDEQNEKPSQQATDAAIKKNWRVIISN